MRHLDLFNLVHWRKVRFLKKHGWKETTRGKWIKPHGHRITRNKIEHLSWKEFTRTVMYPELYLTSRKKSLEIADQIWGNPREASKEPFLPGEFQISPNDIRPCSGPLYFPAEPELISYSNTDI